MTKSQKKTIIWSANGNSLAQRGSKVELPTSGQLVLSYTNMQQVWAADVAASGVNYVSMHTLGTLCLQDKINLWESFNSPTDTILSTQVLNQDGMLVYHISETNYSIGNFQFLLQSVGDLVQSFDVTHNFVRYMYWESNPLGTGFQFFFNQSSTIYLMARNGTILDLISRNPVSTTDFF